MNQDIVQAKYDVLETITQKLGQLAESNNNLNTRVRNVSDDLIQNGWKGQGADAFSAEMSNTLLPACARLTTVFQDAQKAIRRISEMLRQAEEEAAALFNGAHNSASFMGSHNSSGSSTGGSNGSLNPNSTGASSGSVNTGVSGSASSAPGNGFSNSSTGGSGNGQSATSFTTSTTPFSDLGGTQPVSGNGSGGPTHSGTGGGSSNSTSSGNGNSGGGGGGGGGGSHNLAWGSKVSQEFRDKVLKIAKELGIDPDWLMACMAFESGETFSASVKNALSGATGLIQFMPGTARALGTTTEALANMTPEQQLDYVEKYFEPYKGKLNNLQDVYMVILDPKAVGKSGDFVLFDSPSKAYEQNKGLDGNHDGQITKEEAATKVINELRKGSQKANQG